MAALTEQSSCLPEWTDFDTEIEMVLSTLSSMFGELPSAPAAQESLHLPGDVHPELGQSGFTDGLSGTVTHEANPYQCGATTVPSYGGVLSDHNVGAGFKLGATMEPLCCEYPYGSRWLQFPPGFLVPQPCGPMAGALVNPMYPYNSFIPNGFMNHQQGACFSYQMEHVPALEDADVSSHGPFNGKQRVLTNPCPEPSPQALTTKRKRSVEQNGAYIRRPPNAFLIFMRENREIITRTLKPKHSVEANTILGEIWRKMSSDDREIYYQKATEERRIHAEKHPEWSSKDNYGRKVKRQRKQKNIIV